MQPSHERRFEQALGGPHPFEELYALAEALRDEGLAQIDVYSLFASYQTEISSDDSLYDAVIDSMDEIYGGPWAKRGGIFPTNLTEEMIRRRTKGD